MDMQEKIIGILRDYHGRFHDVTADAIIAVLREQEPVHWRAVLDKDQVPQQLNPDLHVVGFRQFKAAESWTASRLDFDGWRYAIEPLYALPIPPVEQADSATEKPDMFWDDDDPERCCDSPDEVLNRRWEQDGLSVGDCVVVQQAVRLPNLTVRITKIDEENGDIEYEEIDAALSEQPPGEKL